MFYKENVPPMAGFYTDGLDKVLDNIEIVYPEKVSKDGSFVSYYLPHYYNMESLENRPRRTSGHLKGSSEDAIHFFVPIDGEKHHLELWPNLNFISPGLVVERRDARDVENINKAKISQISQRQCHYNGQIVGKPNSSAALSTCYGLAGYIRVPAGEEYMIEPVKDSKPTHDKEHPHIMYKRSGMKDRHGASNCLTKGRAKEALEERMQWEALFGDEVRKELSGININELVQESVKKPPDHNSFKDKLPVDSFSGDLPLMGKTNFNNENLPPEDRIKIINTPQIAKVQYGTGMPEESHSEHLMKNALPHFGTSIKNGKLYLGNKLKHKSLKDETNMGNIKLSDVNFNTKAMPGKVLDGGYFNGHGNFKYATGKQINEGNIGHKRVKRDLSNDNNDLNSNKNTETQNMNIYKLSNSKNGLESEQTPEKNKINPNEITRPLDIESQSANDKENHAPSNTKDSSGNNPYGQSKRDLTKVNQEQKLCNEKTPENTAHGIKGTSGGEKQQISLKAKTKRESFKKVEQSSDGSVSDETSEHLSGQGNSKQSSDLNGDNKPSSVDLSLNEIRNIRGSKNSQNNDESNLKRDIHLDTSEKSWQSNENPEKSKTQPDQTSKNSVNEELNNKLSEENPNSNLNKNTLIGIENDKSKDLKTSKIVKVDKDTMGTDEKLMASILESVVKDVDKSKVKKEISDGLGSTKLEEKYKEQPIYSKTPTNEIGDNDKYIKFEQICLTNSKDTQEKDDVAKAADNTQKLVFVSKETGGDTVHGNELESVVQSSQDKTDPNHIDEIVIRIKTPEGSISEVKQQAEPEVENFKKENISPVKATDMKDSLLENKLQSAKTSFKSVASEKNKRGIDKNDNLPFIKKNDQSNYQRTLKDEEDPDTKRFNIVIEKQPTNLNSNGKSKRDENTIHLIIHSEPEETPQRSSLFCQGKNCLDIKPVLLNESNVVAASSNTTSNSESVKSKMVEKRQAWDDCAVETTTEVNLICFDFYSKMFNLELMITVDYKVVKMHSDDDIENFILTVINMVSTNFYDKTIGINLSVVLVRLILLTTCIKELDSDRFNPEELLENFCTWQVLINPGKDDHPHHHDLAIFVTRMEKCEGQVMGVTYMTSVCRPDKACLVCVDEGLLLANTITHQIGHSLGADHDDSESMGCAGVLPDGTSFHMAPTITETSSAWSPCSRDSIIQFVRTQGSWCLTDLPIERTYNFPLMLPGQIYSAAQQCKLNFHMTALPCSVGSFCERLYCQVTEKLCATKGDPPADGTFCASDMWCFHKQCVHVGRRPGSINGEWSPWTEWSICTRSCGGGVSSSYRICNNPKPENGGRYCVGERIRQKMCATKPCQGFTESFRDLQCKKTEDRPFRGKLHNWVQYHSFFLNIECALVCQNRKGEVVMRSPIVADGTPCKAGTRNVCIQGACRNVGCDWVIDSKAKEDACGICHGNSTECKIVQGVFDENSITKGLVEFLRIPKDSGMIFVREISPSANILVVSGSINRVFYLNGQGNEDTMPGDVSFGLTHGVYEVRSAMERIFIRGPTTEELIFYVLFREPNKGIHFQYAVRETDPNYVPRYLWQYLDWDPCTDPCSGGSQRAHPKCVEDRGGVVDDQYCTESSQPSDIIRPCNDFPCLAKWWVSVWSDCICTGSYSVMFRSVLCMRATDESGTRAEIVKESECAGHKKPPTQKPCNATEDELECVKRSISGDMFGPHRDIRRAVNPKTVFAAFSPEDHSVQDVELLTEHPASGNDDKEKTSSNKNQKKSIKPQANKNANIKGAVNKLKPKLADKEPLTSEKKKIAPIKGKEIENLKAASISKSNGIEELKPQIKPEDLSLALNKGKQIVKLNSKSGAALSGEANMKNSDKSKQVDDSDRDTNSQDLVKVEEKCEGTTTESTCPTPEPETTEASTCRQTCPIQPHRRTTCCKTTPRRNIITRTPHTTTLRPVNVKVDNLDINNFALTVVPLDFPGKKKLPQSDPEFINLGNIGQFGVADENNGTIISGQEALDFLEFARSNASEEPVILHEDMHN